MLGRDGTVYLPLSAVAAIPATHYIHQVGGFTVIGWQYWFVDSNGDYVANADGEVGIELQGRLIQKDGIGLAADTLKAGPWTRIGVAQNTPAGALIRDVTPIAVSQVRIVPTLITLGSGVSGLTALIRLS